MKNKKENLEKLLSELLSDDEAVKTMADIVAGDELIERSASPAPDAAIVRAIKSQVTSRLRLKKRRRFVRRRSEAVAAAVLVIGVLLGLVFMQSQPKNGIALNFDIWGGSTAEAAEIDSEYAMMVGEIEEIEASLLSIRLDEDDSERNHLLGIEIEIETLGMEGSFWKG